mmetsp:Transcript_16475/g.29719  ORF Transcript_16475/g.29719 Transcript_16475/m.29719 type:complete len:747 (-) Transcript_16475:3471-5711(-)|eukprot:CAMPEP_0204909956 /NCGR_PEP_ID=MMETSP1397-20131031/8558_1 /ASSEMBLY_ACC=CAM_ASM_000891 /TAXON_ID=49980 /ORGANISM="Climacostomum Climacostomum virens, Strain Stock W-24" /LENGTH=746 /DNA_ID=CAMNT_0052079939 /DNA_START=119 /DNA_END=2356 /DNA_ORIENTATION=-
MDSELLALQTRYANIEKAEIHYDASRVRTLKGLSDIDKLEICACCKMPYNAPLFDIGGRLEDMGEMGIGFPLFFYYMKYIWLLLLLICLIAGIPCLIANMIEDKQGQWGSGSSSWYLRASSAAYGDSDQVPWWEGFLHSLAVLAIILFHEKYKVRISEFARETDFFNVSPSDFTVWVKNLNPNFDLNKLKNFLANSASLGVESVCCYNIVHDVHELMKDTAELAKLETEFLRMKDYKLLYGKLPSTGFMGCKKVDLAKTEKELTLLRGTVRDLREKIGESKSVGQVFVTFNKQTEASQVEDAFTVTNLKKAMSRIFFCCYATTGYFEDTPIKVVRAPEPSDILWENLQVSYYQKMRARMWTWFVTFVLIAGNLVVLFYLKTAQTQVYDDYKDTDASDRTEADLARVQSLSILISLAIIFVNRLIVITVRKLSLREHMHTWTDYNISVCHKLVVAMTLNSAGLIAIVNRGASTSDWYQPSGLLNDVSTLILTMGITSFLVPLLSPMWLFNLLKKNSAAKQAAKGKLLLSQTEANLLWQGPEFDLSDWYASNLKFVLIALIFCPIFPTGLLICLVSQVFQYWSSKYILLRRSARPRFLGSALSHQASRWIPVIAVLYAVAILYITDKTSDSSYRNIAPIIALSIVGIYFIFPFKYCKSSKESDSLLEHLTEQENDFKSNIKDFFIDYERANPYTSKHAWTEWLKLAQGHKKKTDYMTQAAYYRLSGNYPYEYPTSEGPWVPEPQRNTQ